MVMKRIFSGAKRPSLGKIMLMVACVALTVALASGMAWALTKIGTDGPDTLTGTNGADTLVGKGGNDKLFPLSGDDSLRGGPGKDILSGGSVASPLGGDKNSVGGRGNDIRVGGLGRDTLFGDKGNDFMFDENTIDEVVFFTSKDFYSGGAGNDVIGVDNSPAFKDKVTCGGGFEKVFADGKDRVAPDCERVADTPSEYKELSASIPQSFFLDLHPHAFQ